MKHRQCGEKFIFFVAEFKILFASWFIAHKRNCYHHCGGSIQIGQLKNTFSGYFKSPQHSMQIVKLRKRKYFFLLNIGLAVALDYIGN